MNKSQKIVIGIILILMGIVTFLFMTTIADCTLWTTIDGTRYSIPVPSDTQAWLACLLGIVFTGAGIFVLISKKRR